MKSPILPIQGAASVHLMLKQKPSPAPEKKKKGSKGFSSYFQEALAEEAKLSNRSNS